MNAEIYAAINEAVTALRIECYLVGGFLRDLLLGVASHDLDLSINEGLLGLVDVLKNKLAVPARIYPEFLTANLKLDLEEVGGDNIDICQFRQEVYPTPGSLPVVQPGTIVTDISRRDFTINTFHLAFTDFYHWSQQPVAIRLPLQSLIVDPYNGLADLAARKIKILHDGSFLDDPTRIFRAARYQTVINGSYESRTEELIAEAVQQGLLRSLEPYRIASELQKIALLPCCVDVLRELTRLGVFTSIFQRNLGDSAKLDQELRLIPAVGKPSKNLVSCLSLIISAYGAADRLNLLGLKNGLNKEILKNVGISKKN